MREDERAEALPGERRARVAAPRGVEHRVAHDVDEVGVAAPRVAHERRGLLDAPARTPAGYRQYDDDAVERLVWIRRAKDLGFTLSEIAELLAGGARSPAEIAASASAKSAEIDSEIVRLREVRARLDSLVGLCDGGDGTACVRLGAIDTEVSVTHSLQDANELLA